MEAPKNIPAPGWYYHYKHDPQGPINRYAYEVLGVGVHTEDRDQLMVVYRPLYEEASAYKAGKLFDIRPLDMWLEEVKEKGGRRFTPITNPETIAFLEEKKRELYG